MPELPEVETVRRGLSSTIGELVVGCDVRRRDVVRDRTGAATNPRRGGIDPGSLLIGCTISSLERHGKQLAIVGTDRAGHERVVVVQLGMSGQLTISSEPKLQNAKHAHIIWQLDQQRRIIFRDARRFGGVTLLSSREDLQHFWSSLGPDGLSVSSRQLRAGLGASKRMIKAALLDQRVLAGVGNIYADEALHRSGIDPRSLCVNLRAAETTRLAKAIREVLRRAVDAKGSTLRDYRGADDQPGYAQLLHRVYGRGGLACPSCGSVIEQSQIAQRTTCWCPRCQSLPEQEANT